MMVYELIQKLNQMPQHAEVQVITEKGLDFFGIANVRQMKKAFNKPYPVIIEARNTWKDC